MGKDYIVLGLAKNLPRIGGVEHHYDELDDPRTVYLHIQDSMQDKPTNPQGIEKLLDELTEPAGAIMNRGLVHFVAKPARPQSVWGAASWLEEELLKRNYSFSVTALPLELENDDEFFEILEGTVPALNRNGNNMQRTEIFERELNEAVESLMLTYRAWKDQPNSRVREQARNNARAYFKQYFPSTHATNNALNDALRSTDEQEVLRILRAHMH